MLVVRLMEIQEDIVDCISFCTCYNKYTMNSKLERVIFMKMKYRILMLITILSLGFITVSAYSPQIGDIIGKVFYTDIVTVLDGKTVPSVNIGGRTAIIVEDLSEYGYDVNWSNETRTLDVKTKEKTNSNSVSTITGMVMLSEGQVAPKGGLEVEIGVRMKREIFPEGVSGVPGSLVLYTKAIIYEGNNFATYSIHLPYEPKEKDYQLEFQTKYNQKRYLDYISINDGKKSNINYTFDIDFK